MLSTSLLHSHPFRRCNHAHLRPHTSICARKKATFHTSIHLREKYTFMSLLAAIACGMPVHAPPRTCAGRVASHAKLRDTRQRHRGCTFQKNPPKTNSKHGRREKQNYHATPQHSASVAAGRATMRDGYCAQHIIAAFPSLPAVQTYTLTHLIARARVRRRQRFSTPVH